jgi:hypothetical protein
MGEHLHVLSDEQRIALAFANEAKRLQKLCDEQAAELARITHLYHDACHQLHGSQDTGSEDAAVVAALAAKDAEIAEVLAWAQNADGWIGNQVKYGTTTDDEWQRLFDSAPAAVRGGEHDDAG